MWPILMLILGRWEQACLLIVYTCHGENIGFASKGMVIDPFFQRFLFRTFRTCSQVKRPRCVVSDGTPPKSIELIMRNAWWWDEYTPIPFSDNGTWWITGVMASFLLFFSFMMVADGFIMNLPGGSVKYYPVRKGNVNHSEGFHGV